MAASFSSTTRGPPLSPWHESLKLFVVPHSMSPYLPSPPAQSWPSLRWSESSPQSLPWRRKHPFSLFLSHKVYHMNENFVAKSPEILPKLLLLFVVALLGKSQRRSWWDPIRIFCLVFHYIWCWGIQKNEKDYHLKSKLVQILPPLG